MDIVQGYKNISIVKQFTDSLSHGASALDSRDKNNTDAKLTPVAQN